MNKVKIIIAGPVSEAYILSENQLNKLEFEDTMAGIINFVNGDLKKIKDIIAVSPIDHEESFSFAGEKVYAFIGGIAFFYDLIYQNLKHKLLNLVFSIKKTIENGLKMNLEQEILNFKYFIKGSLEKLKENIQLIQVIQNA